MPRRKWCPASPQDGGTEFGFSASELGYIPADMCKIITRYKILIMLGLFCHAKGIWFECDDRYQN